MRRQQRRWGLSASRPTTARPVPDRALPDGRLNRLAGPDAWDDPEWMMFSRAMDLPPGGEQMHRKPFELTQCVWGLERLGVVTPDAVCLGVGAGHDHVVFYLANRCRMMVATDLFAGAFTESLAAEADPDFLRDPARFAPFDYRQERLRVLPADGLHLPFADDAFDIVYSLSSIEHFGGHEAAAESMREMARVTKPGGVVCVATEMVLNGVAHPEFFLPDEFEAFVLHSSSLIPVEQLDASPPPARYVENPIKVPEDALKTPHLVLTDGVTVWTSVIVFLRKPAAGLVRQLAHRLRSSRSG